MSKPFDEIDPRAEAFGQRLRREREMRGISLDQIAATTKISTRLLRALEAGQLDLLPGGIFNKNYVRAYASHLGMDEEAAAIRQRLLELEPGFTVQEAIARSPFKRQQDLACFADGLKRAGLPERGPRLRRSLGHSLIANAYAG